MLTTRLTILFFAILLSLPVFAEGSPLEKIRAKAEQGDADAQILLGSAYYNGEGVVKNKAEAIKWFRKAAEQGNAAAQSQLGDLYANGQGVVKNELIAYQWFLLASANGIENSKENVSILEKNLTAELRAEGQRLATEWQADFEKRQENVK